MTSVEVQPNVALSKLLQNVCSALEIGIVGVGAVRVGHVRDQVC